MGLSDGDGEAGVCVLEGGGEAEFDGLESGILLTDYEGGGDGCGAGLED